MGPGMVILTVAATVFCPTTGQRGLQILCGSWEYVVGSIVMGVYLKKSWMVEEVENPIFVDDLGVPLF